MFPLKDTIQARSFPIVNWLLIALNVLMFMVELSTEAHGQIQSLVNEYAVVPARFLEYRDAHELATLFTAMFLHGGWFHLFSNMWALYIFGDNVEDRMGPAKYLVFYLLCGLVAGLTHIYVNRDSTMPSLGASGAIAGVLAAYLVLYPQARIVTLFLIVIFPLFVEIPAVLFVGIWFFSQVFNGTLEIVQTAYSAEARQMGGVAWWAHIGGFLAGALLVWVFAPPQRKPRPRYVDQYYPW